MSDGRISVMHLLASFEIGGAESVALNLGATMDRRRFRVAACSLNGPGPMEERFRAQGIPTRFLAPGGGKARRIARLARLLRQDGVHVLHCHNQLPAIFGALGGRLARVGGIVATRHSISISHKSGQPWWLEKAVCPLTSRQVAVADGVRRTAVKTGRMTASKAVVIYNGVDTERFRAAPRNGSKPWTVVGCVARLSGNKRHCDIIEAVRILRDGGRDVRFHIVGDGAERQALEAQAKRLGLEKQVVFFGSRSDVPALLGDFDVFALASRLEGLPLTILEAMASGLPIVATEVGSVGEIVEHGANGFLVPPDTPQAIAESLGRLVQDAALRRRMGETGRKRAETKFSLAVAAEKHAALYLDALGRKAPCFAQAEGVGGATP